MYPCMYNEFKQELYKPQLLSSKSGKSSVLSQSKCCLQMLRLDVKNGLLTERKIAQCSSTATQRIVKNSYSWSTLGKLFLQADFCPLGTKHRSNEWSEVLENESSIPEVEKKSSAQIGSPPLQPSRGLPDVEVPNDKEGFVPGHLEDNALSSEGKSKWLEQVLA